LNFSPKKLGLFQKIKARSIELGTITETRDGIIQGKVDDHLFLDAKIDDDSKRLLFGRNIERYKITFKHSWVSYKPREMMALEMRRVKNGNGPGLRMRDPHIFERPKILTRQTADAIIAAYDEDRFYYANTLHGTTVTDKSYHPHYVLGVLNSKIATWYYRSNTDEEGKAFAQIKIELLRKVPIPIAGEIEQKAIVKLVERIIATKERDSKADTTAAEHEIDRLVYDLYGLAPA
jgi:adenine-specific DNA-methyltransferase